MLQLPPSPPKQAFIYGLFDKKDAKFHSERPTPVWKWILELQSDAVEPKLRVIETCAFSLWKDRERFWIAEWRKKHPFLLNDHDGGNGSDVKARKRFCDGCGAERVRLYPSDSSLRCPVCRKQQRNEYEKKWAGINATHLKQYKRDWYLENRTRILASRIENYNRKKQVA